MDKKRVAMKLEPKTSVKQTYLKVAISSILFLLIGFFTLVYVMDWNLGISQPPQGGQGNKLSSIQTGTWDDGKTWNKGKNVTSSSPNFTSNPKKELDYNMDTVNFAGGLVNNNRNNFKSLNKCKGNSKGSALCRALGNGRGMDKASDVIQSNDGNYVAIGRSSSFNNNGQVSIIKFKIGKNNKFQKIWETQVGNKNQTDWGYSIVQNKNGNYVAVGAAKVNNVGKQAYIIKLSNQGKLQWQRTVGPESRDVANDIMITNKGHYLLTGTSEEWGHNSNGIYVLNFKLRSSGEGLIKRWDRIFGAEGKNNEGASASQLNNGDFVITGYTKYDQNANQSNGEIYVARLSVNGNIKWGKTVGNSKISYPKDMRVDNNDNIVIAGYGKFSVNGSGKMSAIVLKMDKTGKLLWSTGFRKQNKEARGMDLALKNGNYIVAGYSSTQNKSKDGYIAKLNSSGQVQWDKVGGASSNEKFYGVISTNNGFMAVGRTNSSRSGNGDMLIAKVGSNGKICGNCSQNSIRSYTKQGLNQFKAVSNGDFLHDVKSVNYSNTAISSTKKSQTSCSPFCNGFGGGSDEWFNDVIETTNGYIFVGRSSSFGSGAKNIYAVKVDKQYNVKWEHIIGSSSGYQEAQAIAPTSTNKEYVVVGKSGTNSYGNYDIYVVKIKDKGSSVSVKKEWLIGGPSDDLANDLVKLQNGEFILTGKTKSYVNNSDGILVRFSLSPFNMEWKKLFGSPNADEGANALTKAGNNRIAAVSYTDDQNNTGIYATEFDLNGNFRWGKVLGGPNTDKPFGVASTSNDDVVLTGQSKVTGVTGTQDVYVAKISTSGNILWNKVLGKNNGVDRGRAVIVNNVGNIVVTGGFKDQNTREVYYTTLTPDGTTLFTNEFGGGSLDYGHTLIQNSNNDYVIGGRSESSVYSNNNKAALVYQIKPNGTPGKTTGGTNKKSGPIPQSNDVAVVTKQTINVTNADQTTKVLQLQTNGKVVVESGRTLTVEDQLNLGVGEVEVKQGGKLVIPDTASINGMDGVNLTGKIAFENPSGRIDSVEFREAHNGNLHRASIHSIPKGNDFIASYTQKSATNLSSVFGNKLQSVSDFEYFDFSLQSGSSTVQNGKVKVTLYWNKNTPTPMSNLPSKNDLVVAHNNKSKTQWESYGQSEFSGSLSGSGSVTSNKVNNFSEYTFGSTSSNGALPVELTNFTAKEVNQQAKLEWRTASETKNDYFKIQRRGSDGKFKTIGKREGEGTTLEPQNYSFTDLNPLNGTNYYRLKQVDIDGSYEYSKIKALDFGETDKQSLSLEKAYPNPFQRQIQIVFTLPSPQAVQLRLRSASGRIIINRSIDAEEGKNQHTLRVNQNLKSGAYILNIQSGQNQVTKKLIHR